MCMSFFRQIEQSLKDLTTQVRTMHQGLVNEMQQQRFMLQELNKQVQMQREELQQLKSKPVPTASKNLNELHTMRIHKTRMMSGAMADLKSTYEESDRVFKEADQERVKEQENLAFEMDSLFDSMRTTEEMEALSDEEEEEENPPETA